MDARWQSRRPRRYSPPRPTRFCAGGARMIKTPKTLHAGVLLAAVIGGLLAPPRAGGAGRPPVMMGGTMGDRMSELPDVARASAAQRAAAQALLNRVRAAARRNFPTLEAA